MCKSGWPHGAVCLWKYHFLFIQSAAFVQGSFHIFPPSHSGVTYIFYLIAETFFKRPFHKNDLFQLCPLGKKTRNRQEFCLAIGKKRERLCFSTVIPDSRVSVSFFSLPSLQMSHMGEKYMCYAAWRDVYIKPQSSHFYSFVSCLRREADAVATWASCLNRGSILFYQEEVG